MPNHATSDLTGDNAPPTADQARSPAVVLEQYELLTEVLMKDKPWEYNRRLYEIWRIFDPWPEGFLLHVAGPSDEGVVVQSVWRDAEAEHAYMAELGIERFTEVARVMVHERSNAPGDLLPMNRELTTLAFGPLAAGFIDIGADLDESVGKQFGTTLCAVDLEYGERGQEKCEQIWGAAGLGETIPGDLIMRMVRKVDGALAETQAWVSEDAAREFVEEALTPAAERFEQPIVPARYREIKRIAISSTGLDPAALSTRP